MYLSARYDFFLLYKIYHIEFEIFGLENAFLLWGYTNFLILISGLIAIFISECAFLLLIKNRIGFDKDSETTKLFFGIDIDRRQFKRKTDAFFTDRVLRNFAFC